MTRAWPLQVRLNINQLVEGTKGVAQGAAGRGVQLAKGTKDVAQGAARGAARGVDGAARGAARGVGGAARGAAQNVKSATTGLSSRRISDAPRDGPHYSRLSRLRLRRAKSTEAESYEAEAEAAVGDDDQDAECESEDTLGVLRGPFEGATSETDQPPTRVPTPLLPRCSLAAPLCTLCAPSAHPLRVHCAHPLRVHPTPLTRTLSAPSAVDAVGVRAGPLLASPLLHG